LDQVGRSVPVRIAVTGRPSSPGDPGRTALPLAFRNLGSLLAIDHFRGYNLGLQFTATPMYQIVFNEISAAELAKIPKEVQLELLAEFQFLPDNLDHLDSKAFGVIEREGTKLYRYRANDYRIYFQRSPEGIVVHRVLHKNTIRDFLFRSKLPLAEDEQLEKSSSFWKLIEEGERTKRER
jgi:mRNA-degrading endonuclease RelE of RelBE toxin-antitoxin system